MHFLLHYNNGEEKSPQLFKNAKKLISKVVWNNIVSQVSLFS